MFLLIFWLTRKFQEKDEEDTDEANLKEILKNYRDRAEERRTKRTEVSISLNEFIFCASFGSVLFMGIMEIDIRYIILWNDKLFARLIFYVQ